jgi:2-oxoglutarate ferredoxin oxidoreductase subunit gamma
MRKDILITGTGGQGIVAAGEFLSDAIFRTGLEVINGRSYGAEARGGSCRSEVIASDSEVYDLSLGEADILVVLSTPAFRRYLGRVKAEGFVIVDSAVLAEVDAGELRGDVEIVAVDATVTAVELGNIIVANMVLLGALSGKSELISLDEMKEAVKEGMRAPMRDINLRALEAGHIAVS